MATKRVALVTGATGGLGTHMCKKLYDDGFLVCGNYRSREKAEKWNEEMMAQGYNVYLYPADVSDFDQVGDMIRAIEKDHGIISILINNAGITRDGAFRKMSREAWDAVLDSNLGSVFNCSRHVINQMIEQNYGRIINISSVNAQRGQFGQTNYSAAKAGMHGFTKTLAMEVASKGITVNTISPGYIATDMVMAVAEPVRNQIISGIPVGRLGGTEEIAYLVSFLASEHAGFITGANYAINGGQHVY
ncbi:MAG TPA: acetoacetyl-CoA reductase [Saprospiraceae bacterium]|nr:acetoacetyl-CoA reductase [Saprospiraceae bacterium]MCC6689280.1 acetoacetyl-CoA reductase [Saprospiraceae bacterium]HMV24789.1 acetoacetyl-CoA reductase [Saprospiraceae bacterium]HMX81894.1 acetoacetyl-CoA reductase [Saprospiraceae bacterium]HMX85105.1 acetoacetyl-CoA reductase [Saprospiraceae bacterium]